MSFDPSIVSHEPDTTIWHFKNGKWINRGLLFKQATSVGIHTKPFQIQLPRRRWGLEKGWHIVFGYIPSPPSAKMLRFRHIGHRIPEGQEGYRQPEYLDDNWEVLGSGTVENFSNNPAFGGPGIYHDLAGIVFMSDRVGFHWEVSDYVDVHCWDEHFYSFREYSPKDNVVPSQVMDLVPPFPGTLNKLVGAYFTGSNNSSQLYRTPVIFDPRNQTDSQPWSLSSTLSAPPFGSDWMIPDARIGNFVPSVHFLRSNLFFIALSFHQEYEQYEDPEDSYWYPVFDSYLLFQVPNKWRQVSGWPYEWEPNIYHSVSFIRNSIWDWAYGGSCAEPDMQYAYVRRKSDGSIWKFRNWNPVTDEYTDFTNLPMVPTNPVQGVEYARFFMDGPPIPGNETWNNMMLLK